MRAAAAAPTRATGRRQWTREDQEMSRQHTYTVEIRWTGNRGTSGHRAYSRDHLITATGKPPIEASSDPAFRGDSGRYNPEELLVGSVSACHMLWYLHLCAGAGIVVTDYRDDPIGTMIENADGSGRFTRVLLRPWVTLSPDADVNRAAELHAAAHRSCLVANSVNFPIDCEPAMKMVSKDGDF
jgi:organic hydroperoxide reductase OsmC/OhrA